MSEALYFTEHTLQEAALAFMGLVYAARIVWLFRFPPVRERQAPTGLAGTTPAKGVLYSWLNVAMPWAMESSRQKLFLWTQFVVFHLGVVVAISLSFVIPYAPEILESPAVVIASQVAIGAAFLVACLRIIRRVGDRYMRAISSPDDHFSLALLTVWFAFAFLAAPNRTDGGEWHLVAYFILTAFFLVYVPFSKISHYLYYPFTRYWLGKTLGYRGTYPVRHFPRPNPAGQAVRAIER